jgi:protein involved in temperature-dependent protein secretion
MPDILLWNQKTDALWVIEAVTSDGEVDSHKVQSLTTLAHRCGKKGIGFTTAYATWRDAAARQGKHKNIAPGTYIWIREDGAKQFSVETFESSRQRLHQ